MPPRLVLGFLSVLGFFSMFSLKAQEMSDPQVLKDLEVAQRHVLQKKSKLARISERGLRVNEAIALDHVRYQEGQSWRLAVALPKVDMARKEASRFEPAPSHSIKLYQFNVLSSDRERAKVEVSVPDRDAFLVSIDSKLKVTPEKSAAMLGFDLFPVSIPAHFGDELARIENKPKLPGIFDSLRDKIVEIDEGAALEFNVEDSLGRPVHVIWQENHPWPVYMSAPTGVAVLLKEDR
ncbi:MAG: hypothetical protein AB1540_01220 [Bdellovibrionota bacterium]